MPAASPSLPKPTPRKAILKEKWIVAKKSPLPKPSDVVSDEKDVDSDEKDIVNDGKDLPVMLWVKLLMVQL